MQASLSLERKLQMTNFKSQINFKCQNSKIVKQLIMNKVSVFVGRFPADDLTQFLLRKFLNTPKPVDGIIERLYASISGERRVNLVIGMPSISFFIPEARLIPTTGNNENGGKSYQVFTPAEYKENANQYLVENGFYEEEIYRVTESYGPVTHLFSTYISKRSKSDA